MLGFAVLKIVYVFRCVLSPQMFLSFFLLQRNLVWNNKRVSRWILLGILNSKFRQKKRIFNKVTNLKVFTPNNCKYFGNTYNNIQWDVFIVKLLYVYLRNFGNNLDFLTNIRFRSKSDKNLLHLLALFIQPNLSLIR